MPDDPDNPDAVIADLPDIAELKRDSDFTPFLRQGVPESIQRLALRKLWRLDPTLAVVDGLVDYDDDFTDAAMVVDGLKTAYKVGKGWLDDPPAVEEDIVAADDPIETPAAEEATTPSDTERPDQVAADDGPVDPKSPDDTNSTESGR